MSHRFLADRDLAWKDPILDPGDGNSINVKASGRCELVSGSGSETRTLPIPLYPGQVIQLEMKTDGGGAITTTVTDGWNQKGNTTILFSDAGDMVRLVGIQLGSVLEWRLVAWDVKPTTLTAVETTLTNAGTAGDYAIQALSNSGPYGFVTASEGETVVEVVLNNQIRINNLETKLQAIGFVG